MIFAKLRGLLRPSPYLEEKLDSPSLRKEYNYWRIRIFSGIYVGYALFYFTRKSFAFSMPFLSEELGFNKWELGLVASVLSITYGVSKFLSGVLGDKSNPRYFMAFGLILTGIANFAMGSSSLLWVFLLAWGCNGWFQGWGWPGCAKQLTHWYSQSERGRWWSFMSTSQNLGGGLIPIVVATSATLLGWRWGFYVPGCLALCGGLLLMVQLRDTPQSLGLPAIEKFRNDYPPGKREKEKVELSAKEILWTYVITNRWMWVLAGLSFLVYVIRLAVNDWGMSYLIEVKGYPKIQAGTCVSFFELGGFLGCITGGWLSDLVFRGRRNPISVIFLIGVLAVLVAFRWIPFSSSIVASLFFALFGFFIFGPQNIIGLAAAELSHKKAAGTATGFTGCFSYLGAAAAGGPMGAIIKEWGWDAFLLTLGICSAAGALLMLPLWSLKTRKEESAVETAVKELIPVAQENAVESKTTEKV
ncbi:MAG: MFS transporter [Verrucomicrobiota bacterium]|nr:MFS transporter [Verrucomicrobiota bacterium]